MMLEINNHKAKKKNFKRKKKKKRKIIKDNEGINQPWSIETAWT